MNAGPKSAISQSRRGNRDLKSAIRIDRALALPALMALVGCVPLPAPDQTINPYRDLPPIPLDGSMHQLTADIVPLGELQAEQVIRVQAEGQTILAALILAADPVFEDAGILAGGGPAITSRWPRESAALPSGRWATSSF